MNFSKDEAVDKMNGWVNKSTQGMIPVIMKPPIPEDAVMVLMNAIYFKGEWVTTFDPKKTFEAEFKTGKGEKKTVSMMSKEDRVEFLDVEGYKAVRLPYGNDKTSMYCILPDENTNIDDFIRNFTLDTWNTIKENVTFEEDVNLQIPKFKMEYGIKDLNQVLQLMGIKDAFDEGKADFLKISNKPTYISNVSHKAVIEVNEEGSEAAAVTVVEFWIESVSEPVTFIADRPFMFIIADDVDKNILFMGKMTDV